MAQVAERIEWTAARTYSTMKRLGIELRPIGERTRRLFDPDELRRLYVDERLTVNQCAVRLGCNAKAVSDRLASLGVEIRGNVARLDPDELRRLHIEDRLSVLEMSKRLGWSRKCIHMAMERAGIPRRGGSEANVVRMQRMSAEERQQNAAAAHAARRGAPASFDELCAKATARAGRWRPTEIEAVFLDAFHTRGLHPVPQLAVGPYNLDFAFPDLQIDVEIDPGHWHDTDEKRIPEEERDAYLRGEGWTVLRWNGNKIRRGNPRLAEVAAGLVARFVEEHVTRR